MNLHRDCIVQVKSNILATPTVCFCRCVHCIMLPFCIPQKFAHNCSNKILLSRPFNGWPADAVKYAYLFNSLLLCSMSLYLTSLLILRHRRKLLECKRRFWVHPINEKRSELGEFQNLCRELCSHEDRFHGYFRVNPCDFDYLVNLIKWHVQGLGNNYRASLSTEEKLAVCLR